MPRSFKINSKGFTLIELLVTLSIVAVILSVIVFNQSTYTERLGLANLADDMTLTLSRAQSYGIAVRELTPGSSDFSAAYGISVSLLPTGSPNAYIYFADRNLNGVYDGDWTCPTGGASECLEKVEMKQGNFVESICLIAENGLEDCVAPRRIDISFARPKTEAVIKAFDSAGQSIDTSTTKGAKLSLKSPKNYQRLVVAYKVGQISALEPVYAYQYPSPTYNYPSPQTYLTPYAYPSPVTYHDLTVAKLGSGTGTVTGAGINCGSTCNSSYANASQVTLTATPDSSNSFTGWSGNCSGTGTCALTMDSSKIARATFVRVGPTVTAFDVQPRSTLGSVTATFSATDSTANIYLANANLRRATKSATCTTTINTGCSWSTVATSKASDLATFTGAVGVTVSGNSLTATGGGWASGAVSTQTIPSGDGFVEFTANDTNNYKMGGLGNGDTNQNYPDIEYAAYLVAGGVLQVYESGAYIGTYGTYTATDVFKVAIESGVVKYYKNGVVFYSHATTPSYPLKFDSSFYPGTTLANIKVSSGNYDAWTGNFTDTPPQGSYYIYGVDVYDNFTPTPRYNSEPAKIEVAAGDFNAPVVTSFDVQPRVGVNVATATFAATDAGNSHLDRAELLRATKNATCTTAVDTGCTWSIVATSKASNLATFPVANVTNVTVSGNSLINSGGTGWNAGAISTEIITSGDGFVEFTANDLNNYKMAGLGNSDTNASYTDIEYAVYMVLGGPLQVYESGAFIGSYGTYTATDIFKVAIESGIVKYYKNGVLFYSHATTPTYPLRFDSSFYPGTNITNIKVSTGNYDAWTGNAADIPASGTYIYGLKVYDKNPAGANVGSEPARIEVTTNSLPNTFSPDTSGTLPNSLSAYWKLNEVSGSRADSKGSTALTDNNTVTSIAGKKDNAAVFAKANIEFLSAADNADISTGDINYSLAGWFYLASEANYGTLIAKYLIGTNREYWLGYDPAVDRITWYVYDAAGTRIGFVASNNFGALTTGTWYFVYAEHNATNNTVSISINNGTLDTAATTGPAGDSTATLFIGNDSPSVGTDAYDGRLDEFGFWKRALTAQERTDLYNGGIGNTYTP
jgi:prepilin-type N-terminal cleavage/methylation domain-containing protein